MITDWQLQRRGDSLILGIAVEHAALDVVSDLALLKDALAMLRSPHRGLVDIRIGSFGPFAVTLNLHHDDTVSIFVEGPDFGGARRQSAALWVEKERLCGILQEVIAGGQRPRALRPANV